MKKKIFVSFVCLLLAALMLTLSSCSAFVPKASALSDGYVRTATDEGEITPDFISALSDFSFELFEGALEDPQRKNNILTSPLSAYLCLALVTNGASGETLTQLEDILGMPIEELNRAVYAYTQSLASGEDCKVQLANSVWLRENNDRLHVKESYLQTAADWYDAEQYAALFDDSTVKDINGWVKENTDGMIDSIIEEIKPKTMMYLINTLLFDAKWQEAYEKKQIADGIFTSQDGTRTSVQMMHSEESLVLHPEDGIGFAKKYKGGSYSFVALLPDESTNILEFAADLSGEAWLKMWNEKEYRTANVKIPEFSYDTGFSLNDILKDLGATDMFDDLRADFSKLATYDDGNIFCSGVEQKCFIDVSRNGTKAAAVTWAGMDAADAAPIEPLNIYLDRPFVYAIVDNATGLPLFLGMVTAL